MSLTLSLPAAASAPAVPVPVLVNKVELARLLGISVPTLSARIDQHADFPIVQPGTNGVEWRFDPVAVRDFLARKDAERELADAARREALNSQFALPIQAPDTAGGALTPQQRLALAKAHQVERDLARDAAMLVVTSEVRIALNAAFGLLSRHIDSIALDLAKDLSLSPDRAAALKARLADAKASFRREIRDFAEAQRAAAVSTDAAPLLTAVAN